MLTYKDEKKYILLALKSSLEMESVHKLLDYNYGEAISTVSSSDGVDATSKVKYQPFGCIILDCDLPRKSGEAVINSIRNSSYNAETPVILLVDDEHFALEKEFPEIHFFKKPIDGRKLLELAESTMGLGKGDQRLCAALVNVIVAATDRFYSSYRKNPMSIEGPKVQTCVDVLKDQNIRISLNHRGAAMKLLLSFSDKTLQTMREELKFLKNIDDGKIAKSLTLFTLQRSLTEFASEAHVNPVIEPVARRNLQTLLRQELIVISLTDGLGVDLNLIVEQA